jgi:hypothetical protein
MKKIFGLAVVSMALFLSSCQVQQFSVNSELGPFENGGRILGESKAGMKRGEDYVISGTLYILGINILEDAPTDKMAQRIGAEHYTIETKRNVLSYSVAFFTGGLVGYSKTTVFKRTK